MVSGYQRDPVRWLSISCECLLLVSSLSRFFDRAFSRLVFIIRIGYPLCRKKPPSLIACFFKLLIIRDNSTVSEELAVHYCFSAVCRVEAFVTEIGMFDCGFVVYGGRNLVSIDKSISVCDFFIVNLMLRLTFPKSLTNFISDSSESVFE